VEDRRVEGTETMQLLRTFEDDIAHSVALTSCVDCLARLARRRARRIGATTKPTAMRGERE
jgi:hypothetical protein